MFSGCNSLSYLNLAHLDTSSVINMEYLFNNCSSLKNITFGNFSTSSVTNMEYMFSGCSNLTSLNLNMFDTSSVKKMNYMFYGSSSLKIANMSHIKAFSLTNVEHMFEKCSSLSEIDLSSFNGTIINNAEYMFANDSKLVFVNMANLSESNIKKFDNMFLGTPENMVFCLDEEKSPKTNIIIKKQKACSLVDCSDNWKNMRKKIIPQSKECVDECPNGFKFFDDYSCVFRCPDGSFPEDFICLYDYVFENNSKICTIRNFFLGNCIMDLRSPRQKQKFIENVTNQILSGELYDLVTNAIDKKYSYTLRHENQTYQIYSLSSKYRDPDLVYIDFNNCGKILRKKNDLRESDDIVVFKIEYRSSDFKIPIVEYNLFGFFGTEKLSLSPCSEMKLKYYIPKKFNNFEEYKYNPNDEYFNNKCNPHTSENNTDIIILDRKDQFNKNNMSLCESICTYKGYAENNIICECEIKTKFNSFLNVDISKYNLIYRFKENDKYSTSFWVLKCYSLIFSIDIFISNYCADILLGINIIIFLGAIIFRIKGLINLYNKIKIITQLTFNKAKDKKNNFYTIKKFQNNNGRIKNNEITKENESSKKSLVFNLMNNRNNINSYFNRIEKNKINNNNIMLKNNLKIYLEKTDNELNSLSYYNATTKDKRNFFQVYISLLRSRQILVFTFKCKNDYNSKIIKFSFLLFIFAILFFINILFIDEKVLHNIFITGGNLLIFYSIPRIFYSVIITSIIKNILLEFIFTEEAILAIKEIEESQKTDSIKNIITKVTAKCMIFFFVSMSIISFFWFYFACFFSVFKNTQFFAIKNTLISFGLFLIIPFGYYIIPAFLRIVSLESRERKNRFFLYALSKILLIIF